MGITRTVNTVTEFTDPTFTSPDIRTGIDDINGNESILIAATATAVNEITVTNAATGDAPAITATGTDTNINLSLAGKGTGVVDAGALLSATAIKATELFVGATGAEVQILATPAEINLQCDISAQTEAITTGAISVTKRITVLDTTAGAVLFTLAAPDATMYGQVKVISFGTDNGDATLTLTNVQGGSAATTCTWANVGEELVLVGGSTKWAVISEAGVVLS